MTTKYFVSVTDWSAPRGYKGSGRGWRVRCFGLPDDDWNALGYTVSENFYRSEKVAKKAGADLAKSYGATVN